MEVSSLLNRNGKKSLSTRLAPYLMLTALFLTTYWLTAPEYIGDTVYYAGDVIAHTEGDQTRFWEFGHLLWRPYGYLGHSLIGGWYSNLFGDTPTQSVIRWLIHTNFVCSAAVLILLLFLLRKIADPWLSCAVVFALSCSASFLNYSHSGAPYIPALLFSVLAVVLLTAAVQRPSGLRYVILAGVSFCLACALWFPFSFTGLGMLSLVYFFPSATMPLRRSRHKQATYFLFSLASATLVLFTVGAAAEGVRNLSQLSHWVWESGNAWSQSRTAMRAVTGLARSMWDFGHETILLKRWLFSDPYNPAWLGDIVMTLGTKLAAFYLGLSAAIWILWKHSRPFFFMLLTAGFPVLLFAVLLFEPSSAERFLPVFPFACLAFATALRAPRHYFIGIALISVLLGSTVVVNLKERRREDSSPRWAAAITRLEALKRNVRPRALALSLTFRDDLSGLPTIRPLDKRLAISLFQVSDMVTIASPRIPCWRAEFALRTLRRWASNQEVWLSERLLAKRPEAHWLWVEGDDPRIRWSDFSAVLAPLEFDAKILPGRDGFYRLAQNQANRDRIIKELGVNKSCPTS
ncbi:MAG: hypothetical protein FJW20_19170 [Acidimicrobiia bacterium]|nr:hypothetical protein [Acidimicrobiia bacterium]